MARTETLAPAWPDPLDVATRHYFWKLRLAYSKAFELRAYQALGTPPERRVLDLGCSDGTFRRMLREAVGFATLAVGGDFDRRPLGEAAAQPGLYSALVQLDATELPFGSACFDLVLANGVLAHILPDVGRALGEVERVLRPGGRFIFTAPTSSHPDNYWSVRVAEWLRLPAIAQARRRRVNRNEGYVSLLSVTDWEKATMQAGLQIAHVLPYSSPAIGLRRSLLGTPLLRAFGALRWVKSQRLREVLARGLQAMLRPSFERRAAEAIEPATADYVMIVARRSDAA